MSGAQPATIARTSHGADAQSDFRNGRPNLLVSQDARQGVPTFSETPRGRQNKTNRDMFHDVSRTAWLPGHRFRQGELGPWTLNIMRNERLTSFSLPRCFEKARQFAVSEKSGTRITRPSEHKAVTIPRPKDGVMVEVSLRFRQRERAGFSSGPENKIFSLRSGAANHAFHYTHSNRVLPLTNVATLSDVRGPNSHQYWGHGSDLPLEAINCPVFR